MRDSTLIQRPHSIPVVALAVLLLGALLNPIATPAGAQRRPVPTLSYHAAAVSRLPISFADPRGASLQAPVGDSGITLDIRKKIASRRRHVTMGAAIGAGAALLIADRRNDDDGPAALTNLWAMVPGALGGALLGAIVYELRLGKSPQ